MFIAVILVTWILATLAGTAIELLDVKYKKFYGVIVTVVFFFVPLAIILGAYGAIFNIARSHARGREVGSFKKVYSCTSLDYYRINSTVTTNKNKTRLPTVNRHFLV